MSPHTMLISSHHAHHDLIPSQPASTLSSSHFFQRIGLLLQVIFIAPLPLHHLYFQELDLIQH